MGWILDVQALFYYEQETERRWKITFWPGKISALNLQNKKFVDLHEVWTFVIFSNDTMISSFKNDSDLASLIGNLNNAKTKTIELSAFLTYGTLMAAVGTIGKCMSRKYKRHRKGVRFIWIYLTPLQ